MKTNHKIFIVLAVVAVLYFSGAGSTLFNTSSDSFGSPRDYVSSIIMQPEQATVKSVIMKEYGIMLMNDMKFSNGTTGKIQYFWGGKANNIDPVTGIDTQFGVPSMGTAADGSNFYKPYGLDCSGYVHYVMYLSGIHDFPHGSSVQYQIGDSIPLEEGTTGDLLIYRDKTTNLITHIGFLVVHNGKYYDLHCNSADNGIAGAEINGIGSKAQGYYWQEVVNNPYVTD